MTFRDDVEALEAQFLEAFGRGDAVAAADVYTDDAVYMVPSKEPARGRDAIVAVNAEDLASGLKITRLTAFRTESSGGLGYALETYSSSDGDGLAMLTYRRDARGAWRICAEALLPS
jgi:ketosteroid isomerase-like protein